MPTKSTRVVIERLRLLLGEAYDKSAWHGPNLKGLLRGLSARDAARRPLEDRHNIWELTLHCAYWKYAVTRRITGQKRGSFPLPGSNWFARPIDTSDQAWRADRDLLDEQHKALLAAVDLLTDRDLDGKTRGSRHTIGRTVAGAAAHDLYHAGQIAMLKRSLR